MYERTFKEVLDEHLDFEPEDAGYIEIWSYEVCQIAPYIAKKKC